MGSPASLFPRGLWNRAGSGEQGGVASIKKPDPEFPPPFAIKSRPAAQRPSDLESGPWIGLVGFQFWNAREIKLFDRNRAEQTLRLSPVLISEGVTSIREAVRAGLGIALLPDWLIQEDLLSGQLVRVLPQWKAKDLPVHVFYSGHRLLADAGARIRGLLPSAT